MELLVLALVLVPLTIVALVIAAFAQGGRIRALETRIWALDRTQRELQAQLEDLAVGQPRPDRANAAAAAAEPAKRTPQWAISPAAERPAPTPQPPPASSEPIPEEADPEGEGAGEDVFAFDPELADAEASPPTPPGGSPPPPQVPPPTPRRFDWERFVGLRLPIWLGAIALSIAGYFFVSYAIETGFFTPPIRVLAATLASLLFLAGAEAVRRRVKAGNPAAISSALGAASIVTAYATVYLASISYGLIPTGFGFIAAVAVSILAMAIALAYGQVVALIGMIGAYLVPILYGRGEPSASFVTIYVVAITAASFTVIRYKSWWRLSVVGLIGPALWGLIWITTQQLFDEAYWGDAFLIALPVIVALASSRGWRQDDRINGLAGLVGTMTAPRASLIGATIMSAVGFVLFLFVSRGTFLARPDGLFGYWTGFDLGYWRGLLVYGALAVALGFLSAPHRALQVPVLIATIVALLMWRTPDTGTAVVLVGATAIIFGFGALDQFRRLREPGFWATILSLMVLILFGIALFKVTGWSGALDNKHWWALAALAVAGAFVGLLRSYGGRVPEGERSRVLAAWGGVATSLVSLAVVLEIDPLYFPASSAIAVLGLSAVHLRVPDRGMRILAGIYGALYAFLVLGAFARSGYVPGYYDYVFAGSPRDHALILLVLPGLALLLGATLFQRAAPAESRPLVLPFDAGGMIVLAAGLVFLLDPSRGYWPWRDVYTIGAWLGGPELLLALVAIYAGQRWMRPALATSGLILAGLVALSMLIVLVGPVYRFWPPLAVPGTVVFNVALLALGLPALMLLGIGWLLRTRAHGNLSVYGIVLSVFAVGVVYTMMLVDIRQAWHLGETTLDGPTSQPEFYSYSIATLLYGLALLIGGVAFRHRGARALSFVFVLAATVKVFIFDAAELQGLWRVLSFLLMGLSFLGISWAYARFVFGIGAVRSGEPPPPAPPDTPAA